MLSKLSIKHKLLMVISIIIAVGLINVAINIFSANAKKNSIEKLETLTGLSAKIALLVHERQKERGATAGSDARQKEHYDYLTSASVENFSPQIKEDIKHLDTFLTQIF